MQEDRRRDATRVAAEFRIGGFVLALIVLLVIIILSARACARSGETQAYTEYMTEVATIVTMSDDIGNQLADLLRNPGDISRADVRTRLEDLTSQCRSLENQAMKMAVPNDLNSRGIHQMFVLVLTFRATGTESLETYLLNALEVEDTTVTTDFAYLLRDKDGTRVEYDHHVTGLFPRATWLGLLEKQGFKAEERDLDISDPGESTCGVFVGRKPAN